MAEFWRCGAGHITEVESGTAPYDLGTCDFCAALEDRDRLRAAARSFVKDVEDYYDADPDYVAWLSYRELRAALDGRD